MKKKDKLLDMFLEDKITEEQFNSRSADIDKEITTARELLDELTSIVSFEDIKSNTNAQISRLINEGAIEGFNEELFNLIIERIVVGGTRFDGVDNPKLVDDPKSLHFELITDNLDTDMKVRITEDGLLVHSPVCRMDEPTTDEEVKKNNTDLYTFYQNEGVCKNDFRCHIYILL